MKVQLISKIQFHENKSFFVTGTSQTFKVFNYEKSGPVKSAQQNIDW